MLPSTFCEDARLPPNRAFSISLSPNYAPPCRPPPTKPRHAKQDRTHAQLSIEFTWVRRLKMENHAPGPIAYRGVTRMALSHHEGKLGLSITEASGRGLSGPKWIRKIEVDTVWITSAPK